MSLTLTVTAADGATKQLVLADPIVGSAQLLNVGVTALLPTTDSGNAGLIVAQKVSLGTAGTLQSLSFYTNNNVGNIKMALYDATGAGGTPGAKLAETASVTTVIGWNTVPTGTKPSLAIGTYWMVYEVSNNALTFKSGSGGNYILKSQTYGTMPTPFPTGSTTAGTTSWSFYMTIATGGTAPPPDTTPPSAPTNLTGTPA